MGIKDLGEFKFWQSNGSKNPLNGTVKTSLKTDPIPPWAASRVIEAWNVPTL